MEAEAQWVAASQAGDHGAFGRLVERYQGEVYNLVRRMLDDPEEARDVAQDTFVRAYTNLARFRSGAPFRPWLLRIATNLALDRLRRAGRRPLPLRETVPADPRAAPEAAVLAAEDRDELRAALASLPPEYRSLLVMAHGQRLSDSEIMAVTGLSLTLVKNRLYRARLMLKAALGGVRDDGTPRQP